MEGEHVKLGWRAILLRAEKMREQKGNEKGTEREREGNKVGTRHNVPKAWVAVSTPQS
jgi:hypothetical protein